jgi:prolipoprotein diacylglyceryltransferase
MEIGIFFALFFCFSLALSLLGLAFWVWMLLDAIQNEPDFGNDKALWILIIVIGQVIGAAVYYFVRRPEREKLARKSNFKKV